MMTMRGARLTGALVALTAAAAAAILLHRQRTSSRAVRADLYFSDGSMLSLDAEAPEIDALRRAAEALAGA